MNTHFCKVGKVSPNLNTVLNSKELEHNSFEQKTIKTLSIGNLSKK